MKDKKKKEDPVSTDEIIKSLASIIKNGMKLGNMTEKQQKEFEHDTSFSAKLPGYRHCIFTSNSPYERQKSVHH